MGTLIENITATPAAIAYIQKMLLKRGRGVGVRLRTTERGCSGQAYVIDYIDKEDIHSQDHVYNISENLKVYIDPLSYVQVAGTQIDYVKKGLSGSFVFHNPNEKGSCGCGESFYV